MRGTTARVMPQFGLKHQDGLAELFYGQPVETVTESISPYSMDFRDDPQPLRVVRSRGDGIPLDAEPLVVHRWLRDGIIDLNENSLFDIPDTYVGPAGTSFFVGIVLDFEVTGSDFPARYDFNDQPQSLCELGDWCHGPIDPSDLVANSVEFQLVEDAGLPQELGLASGCGRKRL